VYNRVIHYTSTLSGPRQFSFLLMKGIHCSDRFFFHLDSAFGHELFRPGGVVNARHITFLTF